MLLLIYNTYAIINHMSAAEVPHTPHETPHLEVVEPDAVRSTENNEQPLSYEELLAGFNALQGKVVELEDELVDAQNENEALQHELFTDPLTGLLSERGLKRELEMRQADPKGIVLVDVTNFKGPNDQYGKIAGNAILKDVGDILRRSVRQGDLIARLNQAGDEFVIVAFDNIETDTMSEPERRHKPTVKRTEEVKDIMRTRVEEYLEGAPELKAYNFDIAAGDADWITTDQDPLSASIERADANLKQHKAIQHRSGHYDRASGSMQ
jgi:diguanylate cyclase (GGDEF)-like protein